MRKSARLFMSAVLLSGMVASAHQASAQDVERAQSLNGQLYAVATPTYNGTTLSYLRLFSGPNASVFTISIVGINSGITYGSPITKTVPAYASPQFPLSVLFSLAGATYNSTTEPNGYAFYIKNADSVAGYQHVAYNQSSQLFENMSNCKALLNEAIVSAGYSSNVLVNVHTTNLSNYPSQIQIHNFYNTATQYTVVVYDAGNVDGSGNISATAGVKIAQKDYTIAANSSLMLTMTDIQGFAAWAPTATQPHANIIVTDKFGGGSAPNEVVTHTVTNTNLQGSLLNLTSACAVNVPVQASTGTGTSGGLYGS